MVTRKKIDNTTGRGGGRGDRKSGGSNVVANAFILKNKMKKTTLKEIRS